MRGRKVSAKRSRRSIAAGAPPGVPPSPGRPLATERMLMAPGSHPMRPLQIAFDMLLTRAAELLLEGGLTRAEIEHALRAKADALARGKPLRLRGEESHFGLMLQVSGVLHDWWREPRFVGSDGNPKPLPLRGRGITLAALVGRRVPASMVDSAIDWMETAGIFTRDKEGRALTDKRAAIVARGSPGPLMSERGLTMAAHMLGTALHNYHVEDKLPGLTDRQAHVAHLSAKHFRQFRELVRSQGSVFLETIDNWLEDHQAARQTETSIEAGVHVYMFKGRTTTLKTRTRRKSRGT